MRAIPLKISRLHLPVIVAHEYDIAGEVEVRHMDVGSNLNPVQSIMQLKRVEKSAQSCGTPERISKDIVSRPLALTFNLMDT